MIQQGGGSVLRIECGVRLLAGELPPLSARWTHGAAVIEPGVLILTPYIGGIRLLRRKRVLITADRIEPPPYGAVSARDLWSARPGLAVIQLQSAGASLEICLQPRRVQQVVERLVPS